MRFSKISKSPCGIWLPVVQLSSAESSKNQGQLTSGAEGRWLGEQAWALDLASGELELIEAFIGIGRLSTFVERCNRPVIRIGTPYGRDLDDPVQARMY